MPDYYRGSGPPEPDNYDDFETLMSYINALDFTRAVHDLFDAIDYVQDLPYVEATRVASWGYCTGGTIALFAACLRHDLAAAVVYFPSQPTFGEHDPKRPVDVIDLVWNIACPMIFLIGDQDMVLPADRLDALRRRFDQWGVDVEVNVYPGAGHAFNAHGSVLYNQAADEQSPGVPLLGRGVSQAGIPGQRRGDGAAVGQIHGQGVLAYLDVSGEGLANFKRGRTHASSPTTALDGP